MGLFDKAKRVIKGSKVKGTSSRATAEAISSKDPSQSSVAESKAPQKRKLLGPDIWSLGESPIVDIVFLHGLTGDREETWTADKAAEPWPKTLLAEDITNARIITYGYDADVVHWTKPAGQNTVREHAQNLVNDLCGIRARTKTSKRPTLFIAHSLGGLVCQDALLLCLNPNDESQRMLLDYTRGVAFMGTPNAGSDFEKFATAVANIISLSIIKTPNTQLLEVLKARSQVLANIKNGFLTMVRTRTQTGHPEIKIHAFVEELPVKATGHRVVTPDSAVIPGYNSTTIPANHMEMTKFSSRSDLGYERILSRLMDWISWIENDNECIKMPMDTKTTANDLILREHSSDLESVLVKAKSHARRAKLNWQSRVSSVKALEEDLTWLLCMPQFHRWYKDSGLNTFPTLLLIQYDYSTEWEANVARLFEQSLRGRGGELEDTIPNLLGTHILTFLGPDMSSRAVENFSVSLPQSLVGQIFAKFPDCISKLAETFQEVREEFVDSKWNTSDLDTAFSQDWSTLLGSGGSNCQSLWILLSLILGILPEPVLIILSSFNDKTYDCLKNGFEFLQKAKMFESGRVNPGGSRWVVIGRPYHNSSSSFQRMSVVLSQAQELEECLNALHFAELHARRERVKTSASGTNEWIWSHDVLKSWLGQPNGLLWIYGKPGSGKSTLAKVLVQAHDFRVNGYLVADFFYSARGGPKETRHLLMLRSIFYQLLSQDEELFSFFQPTFRRLRKAGPRVLEWNFQDLVTILGSFAKHNQADIAPSTAKKWKFLILFDGFDESDEKVEIGSGSGSKEMQVERQKVLKIFRALCSSNSGAIFKIIVLSRPERDIRNVLKGTFSIDIRDENAHDIARVVQLGLSTLWKHMREEESEVCTAKPFCDRDLDLDVESDEESDFDDINNRDNEGGTKVLGIPELEFARAYLLTYADGVILWVVMIIRELIKIAKSGVFSVAKLESLLSTIPTSVQELYEDIVVRLKAKSPEDKKQSQYIISWLLFAGRALRVDEFRDAFAMFHFDKPHYTPDFLNKNRVGLLTTSWNPVRSLLDNTCGGLVEIVSTDTFGQTLWEMKSVQPDDQVQLIHQTAKDFLLSNPNPSPFNIDYGDCLRVIATACINYLILTFPLGQRSQSFLEPAEPDQAYEALVAYIQDRPLLIYTFEHLAGIFKSEYWKAEEKIAVFAPLTCYLSLSEDQQPRSWWLVQFLVSEAMQENTELQLAASKLKDVALSTHEFKPGQDISTGHGSTLLDIKRRFNLNRYSELVTKQHLGQSLVAASRLGYLNAARLLVAAGAPVNGLADEVGRTHFAPIDEAREYGHPQVEKFLLGAGAARPRDRSSLSLISLGSSISNSSSLGGVHFINLINESNSR